MKPCLVVLLPLLVLGWEDKPPAVLTSITVVGRVETESPGNVSAIQEAGIAASPGAGLDEHLRDVPGFSLFRRSSSLVAHPTAQGVSLRGIGSSGASRTLVLWDGIPANDPFGGWIYWTQFVPEEMERVEISRGASTSVFGDRAISGVLGLFSRRAGPRRLTASYQAGNRDTHDAAAASSGILGRWAFSAWGRAFSTHGYFLTPEPLRGAVDRAAGVRFATGGARVDYLAGANELFLRVNVLAEERHNGTALQNNATSLGTAALHYRRVLRADSISFTAFHTREQFHSTYSAVAAARDTERVTFRQAVPAEATGGAALWQHAAASWSLLGGADVHRIEGFSTDYLFPSGRRTGGGRQLQHGAFLQAGASAGPARLFIGARHAFTGQGSRFFSPSGGAVVGLGSLRVRASVYRAFRAPTLNELFREFRVGNAITLANPGLRPETLTGGEAGFDIAGQSAGARITFFRTSLAGLITNVTLASTPNLVTRQRRNAAGADTRGVETEGWWHWRRWRAAAGALYADSRFAGGARIPQVPFWQGSARIRYDRDGTLASIGLRAYGSQFDDDLNTAVLPGFATLQIVLRQRLVHGVSVSFEAENLAGRSYYAGFTPSPVLGAPRLWRAGLIWEHPL